ncbi:hypothetical protein XENTR_v10011659 [Xenopus tropicalis]|nr:hypothetical protein XENTR_v10011659 [Xenopus tropicalis]
MFCVHTYCRDRPGGGCPLTTMWLPSNGNASIHSVCPSNCASGVDNSTHGTHPISGGVIKYGASSVFGT